MRGLSVPFTRLDGVPGEKFAAGQRPSRAFTASLRARPSTVRPVSRAVAAFITLPMSLGLVAPVSVTAASMA